MQVHEIKELIKAVSDSEIVEFIFEDDASDLRIVLRKAAGAVPAPVALTAAQPAAPPQTTLPPAAAQPASDVQSGEESFDDERYITITAPMVGTFYRAPAPDAPPYVEVGDLVEEGQALCIIEAMKLMNEIESEVRGRVVKILVENAEPVEYGQPLFVLEKE
jgi:oxaloacetate decarboxylase alpha subunit